MHKQETTLLQEKVRQALQAETGALVGFAYVGDMALPQVKSLPYAVTLGLPLTPEIAAAIRQGPTAAYYEEYQRLNAQLDELTEQMAQLLRRHDYQAQAMASSKRTDPIGILGDFPHKAAAVRGGLGWIGRSTLLVTPEYGPRVRIATVLTNAPLAATTFAPLLPQCGQCRACERACPAQAISGVSWHLDVKREDMLAVTQCDVWKIERYPDFDGLVCGICLAVCPQGKRVGNKKQQA